MVNELMHSRIVGANMSLGELPHPVGSGIDRGRHHAFRSGTRSGRGKAEFYGNGLESARGCQEEDGACGVGFPTIKGIDPFKEWKVDVMVVYDEQLIFIYCLQKTHI